MAAAVTTNVSLGAVLLALLATSAAAVELRLDSVTAKTGSGESRLRLDSKATATFDPGAGTLAMAGTWTATYVLPNQLTRISHKVEDFHACVDGIFAVRSYECVEGTFGAPTLAANICGNYRFGPNAIDDGGVADDVVVGPPMSLEPYSVSAFDWDGKSLVVTLSAAGLADAYLFHEDSLTLTFSVKP